MVLINWNAVTSKVSYSPKSKHTYEHDIWANTMRQNAWRGAIGDDAALTSDRTT